MVEQAGDSGVAGAVSLPAAGGMEENLAEAAAMIRQPGLPRLTCSREAEDSAEVVVVAYTARGTAALGAAASYLFLRSVAARWTMAARTSKYLS